MSAGRQPSAVGRQDPARVEVVAAIIIGPDGRFLLGQRPAGKVYAGYWEFPGGKVEPGESSLAALTRELREELGIEVEHAHPWLTRDYDYAHAAVRLRFFRVVRWSGVLHGRENQAFAWQLPDAISVDPLLPANAPILRALRLPPVYAISHAAALGEQEFLRRLDQAFAGGLKLVQVREKEMAEDVLLRFTARVVEQARAHGARVLVNADASVARRAGADGVHLTSAQLKTLGERPAVDLIGASCHGADELARARDLGADFAVLGPVLPTPSHPGVAGMGWERLSRLMEDSTMPVYALGGLKTSDLETARDRGAHGVALMRDAWR